MDKIIITIGREKGSGGHYIGEMLAEKLNIRCYDKELLAETAKASGFSERFIEGHEEKKPSGLLYSLASTITPNIYSHPVQQQVFLAQSDVIRDLAEQGSCIFVGRCADYILRDRTDTLNCFVHAPISDRIDRIVQYEGMEIGEAEKHILQTDRDRAAYYMHFTDHIWGSSKNYHLSFNTSKTTVQGAVDVILNFIQTLKQYRPSSV